MKKICLFIIMLVCFSAVTGCNNSGSSDTPAGTESPKNTMMLSTPAHTEQSSATAQQSPEATEKPSVDYVDLITDNSYLYFSASTSENEGLESELGPGYCFDGDLTTRWSSRQFDVEDAWICVSFGYPVIVHGIEISENQTWGTVTGYDVEYYSESDQEWVPIYGGIGIYEDDYIEFDQDTEETYSLRLIFYGCTAQAVTLNEISVTGLFVEVPEGTEPRVPSEDTTSNVPSDVSSIGQGQKYSASSTEKEGTDAALPPSLCFDGDNTTRWSSAPGDLEEAWISVEFDSTVTIKGFSVNEVKDWGYVDFYSAQIWENGDWITVYEGEKFSETKDDYIALEEPVETVKFRLLFHSGQTVAQTVTISEINIYG